MHRLRFRGLGHRLIGRIACAHVKALQVPRCHRRQHQSVDMGGKLIGLILRSWVGARRRQPRAGAGRAVQTSESSSQCHERGLSRVRRFTRLGTNGRCSGFMNTDRRMVTSGRSISTSG